MSTTSPARASRRDALAHVDRWLRDSGFGGYVLVTRGDRTLVSKGYWYADARTRAPNTVDTAYAIGSVSKTFTALAVMQLAEKQVLRLDDRVDRWVPEFLWPDVTVRHLLAHRSGLWANFADFWSRPALNVVPLDEVLRRYRGLPLRSIPGTAFEYSNFGYVLLATVVERASGRSFAQYLKEHVFDPARMTRSAEAAQPDTDVSMGYELKDERHEIRAPMGTPREAVAGLNLPGAGGVVSTPSDLLRYVRALRAGTLVGGASLDEMWRTQSPDGAFPYETYGYGWEIGRHRRAVWHHGGIGGYESGVFVDLESDTTVIFAANLDLDARSFELLRHLDDSARIERYHRGQLPAAAITSAALAIMGVVVTGRRLARHRRRVVRPGAVRAVLLVVVPAAVWVLAARFALERFRGDGSVPPEIALLVAPFWRWVAIDILAAAVLVVVVAGHAFVRRPVRDAAPDGARRAGGSVQGT